MFLVFDFDEKSLGKGLAVCEFADDVLNNNSKYDFQCAAPCALRWVKVCLEKRRRVKELQLMRALHALHHRPLDVHLLQAVSFE